MWLAATIIDTTDYNITYLKPLALFSKRQPKCIS